MDLVSFATSFLNSTDSNQKQTDILMPKQQTVRSYQNVEIKEPKITATLEKFMFGEKNKKMLLTFSVLWPFGSEERLTATTEQLMVFANDFLQSNSNIGLKDSKTMKILSVNRRQVIYEWDVDSWINMNFNNKKPSFKAPTSFVFKYTNSLPTFLQSRVNEKDLKDFISNKFKDWLDTGGRINRLMKNEAFSFIKKLISGLFDYIVDFQAGEIRVVLKQSVVIAGLVAMTVKNNKDRFSSKELKNIRKDMNKAGPVSRLENYIKSL